VRPRENLDALSVKGREVSPHAGLRETTTLVCAGFLSRGDASVANGIAWRWSVANLLPRGEKERTESLARHAGPWAGIHDSECACVGVLLVDGRV
jgi:hypothetical protein